MPVLRRWFVLKQGKIFWFKSDVVTPVMIAAVLRSTCMCCAGFLCTCAPALCLPLDLEMKLLLVQDSIPRGVIEVCWPCWGVAVLTSQWH